MDCETIHILMGIYKGEPYLHDQLISLSRQTYPNWLLWASIDDAPAQSGKSRAMLHNFAGRTKILQGPGQGLCANYFSLMHQTPPGNYWAFADQDDYWLPMKLTRAVWCLAGVSKDKPALYCARSWISSHRLKPLRPSPPQFRRASFQNALVQNIASGNSIVLNPAASTLVSQAARGLNLATFPVVHDWWLYQIVTGVGGQIIHDTLPTYLYRQHAENAIGANMGPKASMKRLRLIASGSWKRWIDQNLRSLNAVEYLFTPANRRLLHNFAQARKAPLQTRLTALRRVGIYRQSTRANAAMWGAAALGKL